MLAVGDEEFQRRCLETLAGIRAAGKTIVLVSHDLKAIRKNCDRAMLLLNGSIQALDSPNVVLRRYGEILHPRIDTPD